MPDSRVAMRRTRTVERFGSRGRNYSLDPAKDDSAFTVTELAFVVVGLALLFVTALPLLGNAGLRSERLVCGNNLRQVGVAFQTWSDSHDDLVPWQVPFANGGTKLSPLVNSAWYHFLSISNELGNPALLACPSDTVKVAKQWDLSADGGFLNPAYRNNALSYIVGCHGEIRLPNSILSADRNINPDAFNQSCSLGFTTALRIAPNSSSLVSWDATQVHGGSGNVLQAGGSVLEVSTWGLRKFVADTNSDDSSIHILRPR
jgi:hypothetical protein